MRLSRLIPIEIFVDNHKILKQNMIINTGDPSKGYFQVHDVLMIGSLRRKQKTLDSIDFRL